MPYFGQDIMIKAEAKGPLTSKPYIDALRKNHLLTRSQGIDFVMKKHRLDAMVAPTGGPPWPTDWINGDHFSGGYSSASAVAGRSEEHTSELQSQSNLVCRLLLEK